MVPQKRDWSRAQRSHDTAGIESQVNDAVDDLSADSAHQPGNNWLEHLPTMAKRNGKTGKNRTVKLARIEREVTIAPNILEKALESWLFKDCSAQVVR